jgi:hypothetical protein
MYGLTQGSNLGAIVPLPVRRLLDTYTTSRNTLFHHATIPYETSMDYRFEPDVEFSVTSIPDGTSLAEFALGYEVEIGTVVYMQILLVKGESYLHDELRDVYDLQFGIREKLANDQNTLTSIDFSYISPKRFVPRNYRQWLFDYVLHCVEEIITSRSPSYITMETYHSYVPPEAMGKYDGIAALLVSLGYDLLERFRGTEDGIDYWYFRRQLTGPAVAIRQVERLRRRVRRAMYRVLQRLP